MEFGFTNDPARIEAVRAFRDAAVADGWSIEPQCSGESVDRWSRLKRDGYLMMILTRDPAGGSKWKYEAEVNIWGPDKLAIRPPATYDFAAIQAAQTTCSHCKKTGVKTQRYSFAGRCCEACLPEMRRKHEGPGWCD